MPPEDGSDLYQRDQVQDLVDVAVQEEETASFLDSLKSSEAVQAEREARWLEQAMQRERSFFFEAALNTIHPDKVRLAAQEHCITRERAVEQNPALGNNQYATIRLHNTLMQNGTIYSYGLPGNEEKRRIFEEDGGEVSAIDLVAPFPEKEKPLLKVMTAGEIVEAAREQTNLMIEVGLIDETDYNALQEEIDKAKQKIVTQVARAKLRNKEIEVENERIRERALKHKEKVDEAEAGREGLVEEFFRSAHEVAARDKLVQEKIYVDATGGSAEEMTKIFLVESDKQLKAIDYEVMYNSEFGNKVDQAMRLLYIIGLSERPEELVELKRRPGWRLAVAGISEEKKKELFGDIESWKKKSEGRLKDTYEEEDRGVLTKYGNTWARKENTAARLEIEEAITSVVGGDKDAVRLAIWQFKLWGIDASMGTERFSDGTVVQEGYPESTAMVELMNTADWQKKQMNSGSPCGPKETRGKLERIMVDFLKHTVIKDEKGTRTANEEWWGYSAHNKVINEEGEEVQAVYLPARHLGRFNWKAMDPDVLRQWKLRLFFGGRKGGVKDAWTTVEMRADEAINMETWEARTKATNICLNAQVVSNGQLWGKSPDIYNKKVDRYKKRIRGYIIKGVEKTDENDSWRRRNGIIQRRPSVSGSTLMAEAIKRANFDYTRT